MELSIGIPTYNAKKYLRACLRSIEKNVKDMDYEVVVVDDASNDDTGSLVENEFHKVKYYKNKKRMGTAQSTNFAVNKSKGKYFLRLDSDTEVLPGSVEKLIRFLKNHQKAGAVGAGLISKDGKIQKNIANSFSPLFWFNEYNFLITKLVRSFTLWLNKSSDLPQKVLGMGTGAVLIKRKVLNEGVLLDPKFSFFMEDSDWFLRMQKAGWEVWYYPKARVIHHGGVYSGRYYIHMTEESLANLYRFYDKHYSGKSNKLTLAILSGVSINLLITLIAYIPSRFNNWTRKVIDTSLRSSIKVLKWHMRQIVSSADVSGI